MSNDNNHISLSTSWLQRILLVLAGMVLFVFCLELGLRGVGAFKIYSQERANRFDSGSTAQYKIVCIGESTTARGGEDSWPSQLEVLLNDRYGKDKFRVFNKGREAIDTGALLSKIEEHLDRYKPQMVVAMMGVNDGEIFAHGESRKAVTFWGKLKVVKLVRILGDRLRDWRRDMLVRTEEVSGKKDKEKLPCIRGELKNTSEEKLQKPAEVVEVSEGEIKEERKTKAAVLLSDCPDSAERCESRGLEYFSKGQFDKAARMLRAAVLREPDNLRRQVRLAWFFRSTARTGEAEKILYAVIDKDKTLDWAYTELGNLHRQEGRLSDAEKMYRRAAELAPEYAGVYLDLGHLYLEKGEKDNASEMFVRAEAVVKEDDIESLSQIAVYYKRIGDFKKAEKLFREIIDKGKAVTNVWIEYGACLCLLEKFDQAQAAYNKVIDRDPENSVALLALGRLLVRVDRKKEARRMFKKLLEYEPENDEAKLELFELNAEQKLAEKKDEHPAVAVNTKKVAEEKTESRVAPAEFDVSELEMRLESNPEDKDTAAELFSSCVVVKDWGRALELLDGHNLISHPDVSRGDIARCLLSAQRLEEAETLLPESMDATVSDAQKKENISACLTDIGNVYRGRKDFVKAEKFFNRALILTPGNTTIMLDLGRVIKGQGRIDEALKLLEKITVLSPDYDDVFIELGNWYKDKGDVEKGVQVFERAIELNPGNAQLYTSLARNYICMGWLRKAKTVLLRAVDADEFYGPAWFELGNVHNDLFEPDAALKMYDRALVLGMDKTDILMHIGQSHMLAGRYDEAEKCFRAVLEVRPDDMHTITDLARCQLHRGRTEEAEQLFVRAMSRDIPEYNDWIRLGSSLRRMRRRKKAEKVLLRARDIEPEKPEAHYELGMLYMQMGYFRKAADEFEFLLEMDGEYGRACLPDLGVCYWQMGFFERARGIFERALKSNPNDEKLYVDLALRYRVGGKFLEAHALLKKALELNPRSAPALIEQGNCFLKQGEFDKARAVLNKAIEINPRLGMAYQLLGRSYVLQGELDKARTAFNAGIEMAPNFWELYIGLWHCIRETNPEHLVGEDVILKAVEKAPYIPGVYIEAGFFYAQNKEYKSAEKMFLEAISLDPEDSVPYVQLADVYILMDDGAALEKLVLRMKNIGGMDSRENKNRLERLYGFLAVYYRQKGDNKTADKYFLKAGDLRMQYYRPGTKKNFIQLYKILKQRGIKLVCMQYPVRSAEPLRRIFDSTHDVLFVSNEDNFHAALKKYKFKDIFEDHFAGDFGHATRLGNSLIAKRLFDELVLNVFETKAEE